MAVVAIRPVSRMSEEQSELALEVIQELLYEYGGSDGLPLESEAAEILGEAKQGNPIHSAIASRLIEAGLFQAAPILKLDLATAEKVSPLNPTEIKINPADLEGLNMREKIRRCHAAGMKTSDIHTFLGIRPQTVHNCLTALAKKDKSVASCKVCGRPLRDMDSIRDGVGPICSHKV